MPDRFRRHTAFRLRLYLVLGGLFVVLVAFGVGREWYQNHVIRKEISALLEEAGKLEARRIELLELARKIESGEFLEREARLELGLQRPGEQVVVIETPKAPPEAAPPPRSNPELWWDYFLKRKTTP